MSTERKKKNVAALVGCSIKQAGNEFAVLQSDKTSAEASEKDFILPTNLQEIDSSGEGEFAISLILI